jgi:uncharacterized membrane protein
MQVFKNFRSYFFRGTAALLPTILTIWIFVQCYIFIQDKVSVHVNRGLVRVLVTALDWYPPVTDEQIRAYIVMENPQLQGDPDKIDLRLAEEDIIRGARIETAEQYWVYGPGQIVGFIVVIVGVCFIGAFLASVMGRTIWRMIENMLANAPLVKKVYPYIKQVTDFLLTKKDFSFSKVVAFEYPRKETWSLGLVTGSGLRKLAHVKEAAYLTVFVPTSPTPFTGYVIMVPRDQTIELDMSIEEALRFVISGGVITPAEHLAFEASRKEQEHKNLKLTEEN